MGCSVGHSTIPYVDTYPEAEVYAIEIGAPMLRYAHARAETLGKRVYFSQQNAEHTNFADGSFDLIVSHILLHETSSAAIRNIVRECHRLLRPGGMMLHVEVPQYHGMDPYDSFILDWDTYNNNEPFWGTLHDMDLVELATNGGFASDKIIQVAIPSAFKMARSRTGLFQGGDFGGGGEWFVFGAVK
jgi:ubiquinone/menaquinone biosynthesis C-methylase UbiE